MKKVRHCGTFLLCGICYLGMIIVFFVVGFYGLNSVGFKGNAVSGWFIQNTSINKELLFPDEIAKKYSPADNVVERYEERVEDIKSIIENICTTSFPENATITNVVKNYKSKILQNNISYSGETVEGITLATEYIEDFEQYLQEKEIEFLYVLEPIEENYLIWKGEKKLEESVYALNSDELKEGLLTNDIYCLSLDENEDIISELEFDASNHWMPSNSLMAAKAIAECLNEKYGFEFDINVFDENKYFNALELRPEKYTEINEQFGYEYYLPMPIASETYTLIENEEVVYEGDFADTLLKEQSNWNQLVNGNIAIAYHNMWRIMNGGVYNIVNESGKCNQDKKVLIFVM